MEELYFGILKVALFLLGIVGFFVILKRYGVKFPLNSEKRDGNYGLKKLDTIHLGYRKFVSVLEIKDRVIVVGVSDKEISLLAQWRKDERE